MARRLGQTETLCATQYKPYGRRQVDPVPSRYKKGLHARSRPENSADRVTAIHKWDPIAYRIAWFVVRADQT